MKNRVERNVIGSACVVFAAALLLVVAGATTSWAVGEAGYHNVAGVSCNAFNNNQANALERNHTRLYNPPSSSGPLWVVCGVNRTAADVASSIGTPSFAYATIFFNAGVTADATCIAREYDNNTEALIGGDLDPLNTMNAVTVIMSPFGAGPSTTEGFMSFTVDDNSIQQYYTVACKLPPGTGLNAIDFYMQ